MKWNVTLKLKILLSNDDGVHAKGIRSLAQELASIAEVVIVAPDRNRSGASNSLTLDSPLRVSQLEHNVYSVQGTPTDCVHFALNELFKDELPDLVLSGINHGANLGDDTLYSGTVAAAMEGHFLGIQAMAFSLVGKDNFVAAAKIAKQIVIQYCTQKLPSQRLLNINIPDREFSQLTKFEVTRLGARHRTENMFKQQDPRGETIYWLGPLGKVQDAGVGTDFYAIEQGKVSITPLLVDLTAHDSIADMQTWLMDSTNTTPRQQGGE